tara:strand:+ start:381 stop:704 length:324 start_codon:yes stop_codon:yes gene_type:complete
MLYTLIDYTCVFGKIIYNSITHVAYYGTAFIVNGFSNDSNYMNYQGQIDGLYDRIRELEEIENNKYIVLEKEKPNYDEIIALLKNSYIEISRTNSLSDSVTLNNRKF